MNFSCGTSKYEDESRKSLRVCLALNFAFMNYKKAKEPAISK